MGQSRQEAEHSAIFQLRFDHLLQQMRVTKFHCALWHHVFLMDLCRADQYAELCRFENAHQDYQCALQSLLRRALHVRDRCDLLQVTNAKERV